MKTSNQPTESQGRTAATTRDEALAKCFRTDEEIIAALVAAIVEEFSTRDARRLEVLLVEKPSLISRDLNLANNAPEEG